VVEKQPREQADVVANDPIVDPTAERSSFETTAPRAWSPAPGDGAATRAASSSFNGRRHTRARHPGIRHELDVFVDRPCEFAASLTNDESAQTR
jgi:hypothetical protein